ncbi:MAG: 16S rRNA (guanine(527)-N(7))-methyltransferase RsmG [Litoreibacter sp.]
MNSDFRDVESLIVSRETMELLGKYENLIKKWSPKINLVAKSTLEEVRHRHIEDSLQIAKHVTVKAGKVVDLGSGGGLPGIVVAILSKQNNLGNQMILIESDQRKSVFLQTAIRELNLEAETINTRIEEAKPQRADVITARALAPLSKLLGYVERHLKPEGIAILPKGVQFEKEVELARESWNFELLTHSVPSGGSILQISDIKKIER